jgi:hypothetical protein
MKKKIFVLGAVVVFTLITVSSVNAGMIDEVPLLSLENNTHKLDQQNSFYNTYMNATFIIFQPDLWSEVFTNIVVPPGGMIDTLPIFLDHKIDEDYKLFFSIKACMNLRSPSGEFVGNAYAFEEGVDPPAEEPNFPPAIQIPLADPRPTPIVMFGYASPPTPIGEGSVELNNIPDTPEISGPTSGKAGTSYEYKFKSIDSDSDNVSFFIKWGDGSVTNWTEYQASGSTYLENHTWDTKGTYTIEAKVKDIYGSESGWSDPLTVTITKSKNKAINTPFPNHLLNFLQNHPNLFLILQKIIQRFGLQ